MDLVCELLFPDRQLYEHVSVLCLLTFPPTMAFAIASTWKVNKCLKLCSLGASSFPLTIPFPGCCLFMFGDISGNFFVTGNHLYEKYHPSRFTTPLLTEAKYWKQILAHLLMKDYVTIVTLEDI